MQKIIVTHNSPDWDAITSVWLLKKYLPGWVEAKVKFVPAGEKLQSEIENYESSKSKLEIKKSTFIVFSNKNDTNSDSPIEIIDNNEIIHVDTGLGLLDHHQTRDMNTCATSLVWEFVKNKQPEFKSKTKKTETRKEAIARIVKHIVMLDHFQEVYWPNAESDIYEFGIYGIIEGFKMEFSEQDEKCLNFGFDLLDAILHRFEQRIWAEDEIKEKGIIFQTRFGKCLGIESLNDEVIRLAQKMGYKIVIRKDPRKGYVRIKAKPKQNNEFKKNSGGVCFTGTMIEDNIIDLTSIYEKLKSLDSEANWFLHVSRKMLLNGSSKNSQMQATKLSLNKIIEVVKKI